ncbi:MAG: tRNA (N(6)-L-threonylcarbamoyladenosine(37)-C(2))-methylthiotransferase MtaB [Proteobacteria bacterium]|nr:tRNA (N(6)-L-threonylcarbamoyladenosine(37)-C(2))-methylthiotransferase MtaB [Pseudomonadota bacterium]
MSAEIITFGCRLNAFEAEVMRGHAKSAGLENAVIINSCAVTAEAVRQARQAIRRARRENPKARIIVTGCAAQIDPAAFAHMPEVDKVLGNMEKLEAGSFFEDFISNGAPVAVGDIMNLRETAGHLLPPMIKGFEGRVRAFVQVQNGCDHRCTFCIIPYGRGNSRSVPAGEVIRQIRILVEGGTREIVLTGVDLTSYGPDLPGTPSFGSLVRKILDLVPELPRLRLSSLDPVEVDEQLLEVIASEPRLMPHLHLSLQAGDDMILKRMKRRHNRADAIRITDQIRALRPDIVFGADLIAGFPTESDEMFENSLRLVEECGLTYLHVFPYSPREGTPAARMPQIAKALRKERAARLRALGETRLQLLSETMRGSTSKVLVERAQGDNGVFGHTDGFAPVRFPGNDTPGSIVPVQIMGLTDGILQGVPVHV